MATFSTWDSLESALLDALASRDPMVQSYRTPDGRTLEFRSLNEIRQALGWISARKAAASATTGVATRRTHAKPFSGGSW